MVKEYINFLFRLIILQKIDAPADCSCNKRRSGLIHFKGKNNGSITYSYIHQGTSSVLGIKVAPFSISATRFISEFSAELSNRNVR